jgi:multiple sugar transport system ATP-binding protein
MTGIRFEGLSKTYGRKTALEGIDLAIAPGTLTVFCGPPGSGKSVLLRLLVGLEAPSGGRILFDGVDITTTDAADRTIGYVPQSFALFPHMSVFDNIAYPMALQGVSKAEIARRVDQAARVLRIEPLLRKRPSELSGGEKQRAAIARGILKNADIFVLDDPLVGLDFKLRESLMEDLKEMRAELGATFLYVTSDSLEALVMAENLVVMDQGRVLQADGVDAVSLEPTHVRSGELVGFPRCNLIEGRLDAGSGRCTTRLFDLGVSLERGSDGTAAGRPEEVTLAIRPEHLAPADDAGGGAAAMEGEIALIEHLGSEAVVYLTAAGQMLVTTVPAATMARMDLGDRFAFSLRPERVLVFDRASGRRVGRGSGNGVGHG